MVITRSFSTAPATTTRQPGVSRSFSTQSATRTSHWAISPGSNLTTGNNNIDIGNQGVTAEANTIRIGTQGTQTKTFIAGINGTGVMGVAVKINAAGQLGTAPSSQRFKTEIKPMDKAREAILALKQVNAQLELRKPASQMVSSGR